MEKLKEQIIVGLTDTNQAAISITPTLDAATAFQLVGTLALHVLESYYKVATTTITTNHASGATPRDQKLTKSEVDIAAQGIKDSMYDAMNNIFSNVLYTFHPDAAKYSIEDEAILELTNKLIDEKFNALSKEEQEKYKETYDNMRRYLVEEIEKANGTKDNNSEER